MRPAGRVQDVWIPRRLPLPALVLVVLLLAAALRFHRLGAQSLWYDEGVAYAHSLRTLPELIPRLRNNVHVPAYFALLGIWQDQTGASEFALRMPSALFGVISVALAYALGARLFHPGAGLAAAALVALNSFSVYYGQEARMYAMLTAVGAGGMWLYAGLTRERADESGRLRWHAIVGLAAVNALGLYTHVSYALVIATQAGLFVIRLFAALRTPERARRPVAPNWLELPLSFTLAFSLFLPWLPTALSQLSAQPNLSPVMPADELLRLIFATFAFGVAVEPGAGGMALAVCAFLLPGLLPAARRRGDRWFIALPVAWVVVSAAVYLHFSFADRYLRFLLPAQLAFALWLGRGFWLLWSMEIRARPAFVRALPRLVSAIALGVCLLALASGVYRLYHQPDFQRDDMRGLVQRIESDLRPGDALIVSAAGLEELLRYYYRADAPVFALPTQADDERTRAQVLDIIAAHDRLHTVFYGAAEQDPQRIVETTLNRESFEMDDRWVDDLRYVRYASPSDLGEPKPLDAVFADEIALESMSLNARTLKAGDVLQIQLAWRALKRARGRYKVFLQLLDGAGALAAQRDSEPAGGSAPTTSWRTGAIVLDNHGLALPAELPAGKYRLIAGLYDVNDPAARLPVGESSHLELAVIQIVAGG